MGHNKPRLLREPRTGRPRLLEYPVGLLHRHRKRPVPRRRPALEDVVGVDPDEREPPEKPRQHRRIVVDPADQGRLVHDDRSRVLQERYRPARRIRQLARVVELGHDVDQVLPVVTLPDRIHEGRIVDDPVRIIRRHLRPDPDDPDVPDLPEPVENIPQPAGIKDQGVAPRQEDVRDLRVIPDVGKPPRDVTVHLARIPDEEALAETVAAEPAAEVAHEHESRLPVFMLQPRRPGVPVLRRRVETAPGLKLIQGGYDQPPDGVLRILPVDQREVVVIRAERKKVQHRRETRALLCADTGDLIQ